MQPGFRTHPPARRISHGGVQVHLWGGTGNVLRFQGVMREPDVSTWLMPLVEEVHRAATDLGMSELVVDIRELEYANAALWRCLVVWLKRVREQTGSGYNLRLRTQPAHRWQSIGVPALRVFGSDATGAERLIVEGAA